LSSVVSPAIRGEDVFARYGGEEFAILSRAAELPAAIVLAQRLRKTVEESTFVSDGTAIRVTISVGVATLPQVKAKTPDELIAAADGALYRAKRGGRNRVEVARTE
jgi:diguanylate cyclase (GGDEF)-like protein